MNNNISFTSRLRIIDPKATEKNKALYDRIAKQFQKQTDSSDFDVQLSRTSRQLGYDKFEVYDKAERKDIFKVKYFDKIEQLPNKDAVGILVDLLKISERRMNYDKLIANKQNEIRQITDSIKQLTKTKKMLTGIKLPTGIIYEEYYNV